MLEGLVSMSGKEVDGLDVVRDLAEGRIRQRQSADLLGLGVRQVERLMRHHRKRDTAGLVSGRRGKRSNNAIAPEVRQQTMDLVREHCVGFGPAFVRDKLVEVHGLRLSVEMLRKRMVEDGLRRVMPGPPVHQRHPRRPCFRGLVQIDGSEYAWFEGRRLWCSLTLFIDNAIRNSVCGGHAFGGHPTANAPSSERSLDWSAPRRWRLDFARFNLWVAWICAWAVQLE